MLVPSCSMTLTECVREGGLHGRSHGWQQRSFCNVREDVVVDKDN